MPAMARPAGQVGQLGETALAGPLDGLRDGRDLGRPIGQVARRPGVHGLDVPSRALERHVEGRALEALLAHLELPAVGGVVHEAQLGVAGRSGSSPRTASRCPRKTRWDFTPNSQVCVSDTASGTLNVLIVPREGRRGVLAVHEVVVEGGHGGRVRGAADGGLGALGQGGPQRHAAAGDAGRDALEEDALGLREAVALGAGVAVTSSKAGDLVLQLLGGRLESCARVRAAGPR